jgi:tetratricopeptide (TPR) repeat protein
MVSSTHSHREPRALAAVLGLIAALVAVPVSAAARNDSGEEAAKAEFKKGQTAYNLGQFQDALASYTKAYELKALPAILFNIAQCHRQLGNPERAVFFYRRYLELAPAGDKNTATAQQLLDESQAQVVEAQLSREAAARRPPVGGLASSSAAGAIPSGAIEKTPVYKQWWLWTVVGVVVVGAAVGTVAYVATAPKPSATTLGTVSVR